MSRWITREHPRVDRVACPWLIERFVDKDPALVYMAKVIRGADTDDKDLTPESRGVEALLDGVRAMHHPNDQEQRRASRPILDALYAFCRAKVSSD